MEGWYTPAITNAHIGSLILEALDPITYNNLD